MSFSVRVTCQEGKAEVHVTGQLPDGELSISGHADGMQRSLGVSQTDAAGRLVLVANANAYKES